MFTSTLAGLNGATAMVRSHMATSAPALTPGIYTVEREINGTIRPLRYVIDEVIPTQSGLSLLVINATRSELISGYDASSFRDTPTKHIPCIGRIHRILFESQDVADRAVLAATELLYQLIPSYGGKKVPKLEQRPRDF